MFVNISCLMKARQTFIVTIYSFNDAKSIDLRFWISFYFYILNEMHCVDCTSHRIRAPFCEYCFHSFHFLSRLLQHISYVNKNMQINLRRDKKKKQKKNTSRFFWGPCVVCSKLIIFALAQCFYTWNMKHSMSRYIFFKIHTKNYSSDMTWLYWIVGTNRVYYTL